MALKAARRGRVPAFLAMEVLRDANRLAAGGADVLHLESGQPATQAPAAVRAVADRLLREVPIGYTDSLGLPELRERIARSYREIYGAAVDPAQVVVTVGASGAFLLGFLAAFDPGDRVAAVVPGYPSYRHILRALDLDVVELPATLEDRFQPSRRLLDSIEGRLDGLIVASPSNPTDGTVLSDLELADVACWCRERGVRLVSDEIYHGITYGAPATTALTHDPDAIIVNSFSKYYSMTGWRLGWAVMPPDLMRSVESLAQNFVISPPTLAQHAAVVAFDCREEFDANVRRYAENRAILLEELPKAGFERFAPADGAFYLYADLAGRTNDSLDFCRRMLVETGVAITPGLDFDPIHGHQAVRFSFAGSTADIAMAAKRLQNWRG